MAKITVIRGLKSSTRRLLQAGQRQKHLPSVKRKEISQGLKISRNRKLRKDVIQQQMRSALGKMQKKKIIFK